MTVYYTETRENGQRTIKVNFPKDATVIQKCDALFQIVYGRRPTAEELYTRILEACKGLDKLPL